MDITRREYIAIGAVALAGCSSQSKDETNNTVGGYGSPKPSNNSTLNDSSDTGNDTTNTTENATQETTTPNETPVENETNTTKPDDPVDNPPVHRDW